MKKSSFKLVLPLAILLFACDNNTTNVPSTKESSDISVINWSEIPYSCKSSINENKVQITIEFSQWTWTEIDLIKNESVEIKQVFTGISDSDFNNFCNIEKSNGTNVVCNERTISSYNQADGATASSMQQIYNQICSLLLDGSISIQDLLLE